jgi:hypothetical protein
MLPDRRRVSPLCDSGSLTSSRESRLNPRRGRERAIDRESCQGKLVETLRTSSFPPKFIWFNNHIPLRSLQAISTGYKMPFLTASRGPVAAAFLPCFETFCRSPVAGSSRSTPRSIEYISRRTYAQPASRPIEDQDGTNDEPAQRINSGPSTTTRRGGMSDEERAKWAFTTKINPTPYDILHLPKTASKHDIKKHCKVSSHHAHIDSPKLTVAAFSHSERLPPSHDLSSGRQPPLGID